MDVNKKKELIKVIIIYVLAMGYASIRYIFFGDVDLSQLASYITNKAFSISAIIYLLFAAYYYLKNSHTLESYWSKIGLYAVASHILISLTLISKEYYPKFYNGSMLNFGGEMLILVGIIATILLWNQNRTLYLRLLMMICLSIHVFFMGYEGWLNTDKWPGAMPPISLFGFLVAISGTIVYSIIIRLMIKKVNRNS